ncbi:MAG: SDR family oxidoreductase [bacterium]|nr:SDR family oxidoreductase [bacterium]
MNSLAKNKTSGRTVLVTGSTGGIGQAVAIAFAQDGWNVVGHYCNCATKASELKARIDEYGVDCTMIKADFISKEQVEGFVEQASQLQIDSLVNNAGGYVEAKHFTELKLEDISSVMTVNLSVPILLSGSVIGGMKERGFGRIVNVSSIAAKYGGSASSVHYGCAKRGLEALTKTLSREGAPHNILVNTVRPGVIDTDFHRKFPKDMDKRIDMIPLKKMGTPQDLADIVVYLGTEANGFVTNEIITVAGGE